MYIWEVDDQFQMFVEAVLNTWSAVSLCQLYWCEMSTARLNLLLPEGESAAINQYDSKLIGCALNDRVSIPNTNRLLFSSLLSPAAHNGMHQTEMTYRRLLSLRRAF